LEFRVLLAIYRSYAGWGKLRRCRPPEGALRTVWSSAFTRLPGNLSFAAGRPKTGLRTRASLEFRVYAVAIKPSLQTALKRNSEQPR